MAMEGGDAGIGATAPVVKDEDQSASAAASTAAASDSGATSSGGTDSLASVVHIDASTSAANAATVGTAAVESAIGPAVAVGGPSVGEAAWEIQESAAPDYSSEPIESRLESKDLTRRCSGYAEVRERMLAQEEDSEAFQMFGRFLSTCVAESLPKGQDAALSALAVYLERCSGLASIAGVSSKTAANDEDVLKLVRGLIEHKAIDKPKLQQLVPPIVLLCAELHGCPVVVKECTDCLTELEAAKKKVQGFFKKQVAFIIRLIYSLLADFGVTRMPPKLYLSTVIKYSTDTDKMIREACYSVLVELSNWVDISEGDISKMLKAMEEPQRKELEKRIGEQTKTQEVQKAPKVSKRRYRGESEAQEPIVDAVAVCAIDSFDDDRYDQLVPVDVSKKLPKGWCITKVMGMEQWKAKQQHLRHLSAALEALWPKETSQARVAPCDLWSDMTETLKRLVKNESNIPVVQEVAKCLGLLAKGLRKDYERPARLLLPVAVARIIDKSVWKPNVLIGCVEQLLWSVPFDFLFEEVRPFVASKSLFAKKEAMSILLRALDLPQVRRYCPDVSQRFFKPLATTVLPNLDDSDNSMRHEACKFLAVLVYRNQSSPEVTSVALDKVPSHRRAAFEEEWKKVSKNVPCPWGAAAVADQEQGKQASAPSRRVQTPRSARGNSQPQKNGAVSSRIPSPMRERPADAPPSPARQPSASRPSSQTRPARVASEGRAAPEAAVAPADQASQQAYEAMAEELQRLRAIVEEMQQQKEQPRQNNQVRVPSVGRAATSRGNQRPGSSTPSQPRDATPPRGRQSTASSIGSGYGPVSARSRATAVGTAPQRQRPVSTGGPAAAAGRMRASSSDGKKGLAAPEIPARADRHLQERLPTHPGGVDDSMDASFDQGPAVPQRLAARFSREDSPQPQVRFAPASGIQRPASPARQDQRPASPMRQEPQRPASPMRPESPLRLASPLRRPASPGRPASPARGVLNLTAARTPLAAGVAGEEQNWPSPVPAARQGSSSSSKTPARVGQPAVQCSPALAMIEQLGQCSADEFKIYCEGLVEHMKRLTEAEAPPLADALVTAMRMYFGHDGFVERCWPLANLLDEFCASRDCVRPLPLEHSIGLLRELLRNLNYNTWTKQPALGDELLRKLNLCCVLLLQNLTKQRAFSVLLNLGTDESDAVGSTLVVKCIKKLAKNLSTGRSPEQDAQTALEEAHVWLRRVHPRLGMSGGGIIDAAIATVLEGARALAEAAHRTSPAIAKAFVETLEVQKEPTSGYFAAWFASQDVSGEKENAPQHIGKRRQEVASVDGGNVSMIKEAARAESPLHRRRASTPATLGANNRHV